MTAIPEPLYILPWCRLAVNAVLGQHTGQRHEKGGHHAEIFAKYRRKY